jgi:porin
MSELIGGFDMETVFTGELYQVIEGGIERGTETPGNVDVVFTLDTEAAELWDNGSFLVSFLNNSGGDPTQRTGDLQAASNIEAPNTLKLYEASYEHRFADGRVALLAGLHDMNADFYALEHGGFFLNSSFGIGPDLSQVGPSIFPTTALGARVRIELSDDRYLLSAVYDGVAGDPANERGTHVQLNTGDGNFYISEIGVVGADDHYYKYAIGAWYHTAEFEDFAGQPQEDNRGFYLLAERDLWRSHAGTGVGMFAQLGFADGDRNQIAHYAGVGLTWTGMLQRRAEDVAGIGIAHASNSAGFRALNPALEAAETVVELSYQFVIGPSLTLHPDLQFIVDPGMDPALDNTVVASIRVQQSF